MMFHHIVLSDKREEIMVDLAWGKAFDMTKEERQRVLTKENRSIIKSLIEVYCLYENAVNKEHSVVRCEFELNKCVNTVTEKVDNLISHGLFQLVSFAGGKRVVPTERTLSAYQKVILLKRIINAVTEAERIGSMSEAHVSMKQKLIADSVYLDWSDDKLAIASKEQIDNEVSERVALRQLKKRQFQERKAA